MSDIYYILGFALIWIVLQVFIFPRLGIPT